MAKGACVFSGLVWGLFWIPLRLLSDSGIEGPWATALFYVVPMALLSPLLVLRARAIFGINTRTHISIFLFALAMGLYATAFLYTEIVRAMFLYYLTPIWGFIIARLVLGEAITPIRMLSILFGICGAFVIFDFESGIPLPKYLGDWMAIAGGVVWAITSLLLLMEKKVQVVNYTAAYFFWGAILAVGVAFLSENIGIVRPQVETMLYASFWLVPVVLLIVLPGVAAAVYGATKLNPGTVGLLFMTEISVGTVAAILWAGEPFGAREIAGVILITLAGISEPLLDISRQRRALAR
jgi:drug/metabolite transporter (DMT)-like permease